MSRCQHLIDISPYDPLCDHPFRLYGGGVVEAECETCQYRIADLEAENAKMRKLLQQWYPHMVKRVSKDALSQWGDLQTLREVGIEVD